MTTFAEKAQREAQHKESVVASIASIVAKSATEEVADRLASLANEVASHEGRRQVYFRMGRIESARLDPDDAAASMRKAVGEMLINGADDDWSGRRNDNRRARFDGMREAARDVLDTLTYGS